MRSPSDDEIGGKILENCIEKNFHVSNMKSGLTRSVRVRCNLKRDTSSSKVNKERMVDTLASQAMKDVSSCDKPGGAAKER